MHFLSYDPNTGRPEVWLVGAECCIWYAWLYHAFDHLTFLAVTLIFSDFKFRFTCQSQRLAHEAV